MRVVEREYVDVYVCVCVSVFERCVCGAPCIERKPGKRRIDINDVRRRDDVTIWSCLVCTSESAHRSQSMHDAFSRGTLTTTPTTTTTLV